MNFLSLPKTDPLMVRRFTFLEGEPRIDRSGTFVFAEDYEVEDLGLADRRLDYDEDVVDCSHRMFQFTNDLLFFSDRRLVGPLTIFNSRRWRVFRSGPQIDRYPDHDHPL